MTELLISGGPLAAVLISLVAAVAIFLFRNHPNLREACTLAAAVIKFAIVFSMLPTVLDGGVIESRPLELVPGSALHLRADAFGMVFALLASCLWVITSVYSIGYMRSGGYTHQTGYYASFAVCVSRNPLLESFTSRYKKEELADLLQKRGVPGLPVNTPSDFQKDPHIQAREFFTSVTHPEIGEYQQPGVPFTVDGERPKPAAPAPTLGQHNEEVYGQELGLDQQALENLASEGVI